jgi:hypothetical protein
VLSLIHFPLANKILKTLKIKQIKKLLLGRFLPLDKKPSCPFRAPHRMKMVEIYPYKVNVKKYRKLPEPETHFRSKFYKLNLAL